jgi:hypothetical protein
MDFDGFFIITIMIQPILYFIFSTTTATTTATTTTTTTMATTVWIDNIHYVQRF